MFRATTKFSSSLVLNCKRLESLGGVCSFRLFSTSQRQTGTVKWFNVQKGYGFITNDQTGEDVFVHHEGIIKEGFKSLSENEQVEYDVIEQSDGKTKALNVTGPNGAEVKGTSRKYMRPENSYDD